VPILILVRIRSFATQVQLDPEQVEVPSESNAIDKPDPSKVDKRQIYRDRRAAKPRPMHITASVLLSRPPLLVPDLHPFEAQVQRYQAMIEGHYYTDFPINYHFKRGSIGEKRWRLDRPMQPKRSNSGIMRPFPGSGEPEWILGGSSDQRIIKTRRIIEKKKRERERREAIEAVRAAEETKKEAAATAVRKQEEPKAEAARKEAEAKKNAEAPTTEDAENPANEQETSPEKPSQAEPAEEEPPKPAPTGRKSIAALAREKAALSKQKRGKRGVIELTDDEKRDLELYAQEEEIEGAIRDLPPEINADLHRLEREPQRTLYCIVKRSRGYHEWSGKRERGWQLIGMGAQSETGLEGLHVV
jgi:39S mitochondrial ribosomal protein L46